MLAKNLPLSEKFWKIPFRISLDNVTGFQALIKGDFKTFSAILLAHFNFIKWIFIHKEEDELPKIKMKNLCGIYSGSIVWQYFINKKKTFSEINGLKK